MNWQIRQIMNKSKFKITQFNNPSGAVAWRLSGTLNGKRIRENHQTRLEAVEKRQEYDVEHLNGEPEGQTVWTTLTHKENRDAIAAINQLKSRGSKYSLSFAVDYCLEHYRAPKADIAAGDAAMEYLAKNPINAVPQYKQTAYRSTAETLKTSKAKELMLFLETYTGPESRQARCRHPEGFLVPFFALALFGGIRPDATHGEISKIEPKAIDLETNVIRIEPTVSKVNEKRVVKIQPNLKLWLERYPLDKFPLIPRRNADRILREVRTQFSIGHDVLRHTFISMTVGAFRSVGDASLQAGNSEAVIRKHYLDLKSVEEADLFWAIVPDGEALPAMKKKEGRYVLPKKS